MEEAIKFSKLFVKLLLYCMYWMVEHWIPKAQIQTQKKRRSERDVIHLFYIHDLAEFQCSKLKAATVHCVHVDASLFAYCYLCACMHAFSLHVYLLCVCKCKSLNFSFKYKPFSSAQWWRWWWLFRVQCIPKLSQRQQPHQ